MRESASLIFPFKDDNENECLSRAFTPEDTVLSAIRAFLVTRKGSRLGNNVGSFLPELLLSNIKTSQLPELATELKRELENMFPIVSFIDVALTSDHSQRTSILKVHIVLSVPGVANISELNLEFQGNLTR